MEPVRPEFVPDASLSHEEMATLQREIGAAATFADDSPALERACGQSHPTAGEEAHTAGEESDGEEIGRERRGEAGQADEIPLVAGVDQAFLAERAVSAIVVLADGEVVERAHAVTPTEIPYIPGLLAFREGGPILAAFETLDHDPDLALFDGSGRIHYRQAGLATHVGVTLDLPAIGVAKRLLCGDPAEPLDRKLPSGARVPILADDEVETEPGTTIGYAVQTRQFEGQDRHVNPVYVSPGHRVSAETAADVVERCCAGYKLPEPIRLADRYADEVKREFGGG